MRSLVSVCDCGMDGSSIDCYTCDCNCFEHKLNNLTNSYFNVSVHEIIPR